MSFFASRILRVPFVLLSCCIVKYRPEELIGLEPMLRQQKVYPPKLALSNSLTNLSPLLFVKITSAQRGPLIPRPGAPYLLPFREAIVSCTELTAKVRSIFATVTNQYTACTHTSQKIAEPSGSNERISGRNHILCKAWISKVF